MERIIDQIKTDVDNILNILDKDLHTFAVEKEVTYIKDDESLKAFRTGYIKAYLQDVQHEVNTYIKLMQPKHWIYNDDGDYECSDCCYTVICDYDSIRDFNYCPCCGSKMEAENENE